ncbi:hypothetical protein C8J57DRAFT_1198277 [Mycena rebaudengoi]|nr:hypothetical protein C8J57DRAFT_1198277 [Mycena rebaudengoi]
MAPVPSDPANITSGLTSILASLIPLLALLYIGGLLWTLDYAHRNPKLTIEVSKPQNRRYAPIAYGFIVILSLVMIAIPSWILLQYNLYQNYPNVETRTGIRLLLFSAAWTCLTAATFTILFVHPAWSRHPISSIGTQSIWVLLTLIFWITGTVLLNKAIPHLFSKETCAHLVYCGHIRAVFVLSVLEIICFTGGMITMMWLSWRCAHEIL